LWVEHSTAEAQYVDANKSQTAISRKWRQLVVDEHGLPSGQKREKWLIPLKREWPSGWIKQMKIKMGEHGVLVLRFIPKPP
jgi:hypothetical protein